MIPELPSNLNTITPVKLSPEQELERLRRFDTYERQTTPEREKEKIRLEELLYKPKVQWYNAFKIKRSAK